MRTLVSKKKIDALEEIPGADRIELAHIEGWQVIVRKGEFTTGSDCIFHEIGCFLPKNVAAYDFLKGDKFQNGTQGTRIKTMKMKGVLSQGLALPLSSFSDFIHAFPYDTDLSAPLGVSKWEDDVDYTLNCKGEKVSTFPEFIRKTDEERVQNCSKQYEREIKGKDFYVTLKLHGSSCTVYYNNGKLGVCSRNQEIEETEGNAYWRAVRESGIDKALIEMCGSVDDENYINLAIQCELVGPKINGNMDKFDNLQLYAFNLWSIEEQKYYTPYMLYAAGELYGFKVVPLLGIIEECEHTIPELLAMADGKSINCDYREGVVFKRADGKFSFKAISNEFLLKEKD